MKKQLIIFIILALFVIPGIYAQQTVFYKKVTNDIFNQKRGPNLDHYFSGLLGISSVMPNSSDDYMHTEGFNKLNFQCGLRYKRKICHYYAMVFDLYYFSENYYLKNTGLLNTYAINADREGLRWQGIGLNFSNRINPFKRRGNHLGNYFDVGGYLHYGFSREHLLIFDNDDRSQTYLWYQRPEYLEKIAYGVSAGIGVNKIRLYGIYRISSALKNVDHLEDLPRLVIGFQYDIGN